MDKILANLKGIVAALYPIWKLYHAAKADQTLTSEEIQEITEALAVFVAVWVTPNIGYVNNWLENRRAKRRGRYEYDPDKAPDPDVPPFDQDRP